MKSILTEYAQTTFGSQLTEEEAVQLCLSMFCTLDFLPADLKDIEWDRKRICAEFSMLAQQGLIAGVNGDEKSDSFWNEIINRFMLNKIERNENFPNHHLHSIADSARVTRNVHTI